MISLWNDFGCWYGDIEQGNERNAWKWNKGWMNDYKSLMFRGWFKKCIYKDRKCLNEIRKVNWYVMIIKEK